LGILGPRGFSSANESKKGAHRDISRIGQQDTGFAPELARHERFAPAVVGW
jgi:hypothetical protein